MAAKDYVVTGNNNATTTPGDTVLSIQSLTTIRPEVYEWDIAPSGTMVDEKYQILFRRFDTDDGTGTAATPRPLNSDAIAATVTCQVNHTVEPSSFTMTLMDMQVHLRGRLMWRARAAGSGFILPAVATEGVAWTPISLSSTTLVTANVWFTE